VLWENGTAAPMKQNKYNDPTFFRKCDQLPRSVCGLEAAVEWPSFRSQLPEVSGKRILDLGCGFGWHCRYARHRGARYVLGVDLSENMLERARMETNDGEIEYRRSAIEDLRFDSECFDLVISSLALHYIEDLTRSVGRSSHG
jgi:ubiquinone/menaquinone biosynthesis C-methylase UbiE